MSAFAAPCGYCADRGRPTPPVPPLWTVLTSEGVCADYACPVCLSAWSAVWDPDGDDVASTAATRPYPEGRAA